MTGNVTKLVVAFVELVNGGDSGAHEKARETIMQLMTVITGFIVGCAIGGVTEAAWGLWSLAVPTLFVILGICLSA